MVKYTGTVKLGFKKSQIAYFAQFCSPITHISFKVYDFLACNFLPEIGYYQGLKNNHIEAIKNALDRVNLYNMEQKYMHQLSYGQRQRVLFAGVIIRNADLILLDEPFNGVDVVSTESMINVITEWCGAGKTIITVMHDLQMVQQLFNYTLLLTNKISQFGKTKDILNSDNISLLKEVSQYIPSTVICQKCD